MKICRKCKIEKEAKDFYKSFQVLDGLNSWCIVCCKAASKKSRENNPERVKSNWKRWYKDNKKRLSEKQKVNHEKEAKKAANWRAKNPEKWSAIQKKYKEEHRAILAARQKMRECLKTSPISLLYDSEILKFYEKAERISFETGIKQHVDHIVPLQGEIVSGLHVPWNLQILPAIENIRKGNKFQA